MPEAQRKKGKYKPADSQAEPDFLLSKKSNTLVLNTGELRGISAAQLSDTNKQQPSSAEHTTAYDMAPTLEAVRIRDLIQKRWDTEQLTEGELIIEAGKVKHVPHSLRINGQECIIATERSKSGGMGSVFPAEVCYPTQGFEDALLAQGTIATPAMIDYPLPLTSADSATHKDIRKGYTVHEEILLKFIPIPTGLKLQQREKYKKMVLHEAVNLYRQGQLRAVKEVQTLEGQQVYVLAMEQLKGLTLDAYKKETQPSPERSLTLMLAMKAYLKQLQTVEDELIVHRDIKPANLIIHTIHPEELSGIIDFGLAVPQAQAEQERGSIIGTPLYLSPDVLKGKSKNRDMYALGLSLAETFGFMKFNRKSEDTPFSVMKRIEDKQLIFCPELQANTYHSALKEQYQFAPERDFAWLLYQMVQPNIAPGTYDFSRFPKGFTSVLAHLEKIIRQQRLIVRARYVLEQIDFYQQKHHQFVRKGGMSMFRQLLQTALDKQNFVGIEKALQKIQHYLQLDPRERIVKLERQIEDKHQYQSLEHNMMTHINRLAQPTERNGTPTVPPDYIEQLRNHVIKARVYSRSGDFETATRYLEHLRAVIQVVEDSRSSYNALHVPLPSLDAAEFMQAVLGKKH